MDRSTFEGLNAEDRLTFLVGRAARLNNLLEREARFVWHSLVAGTVAEAALPRGPRDVLEAIERMLPRIGLTDKELEGGIGAVVRARKSHDARHSLVHEIWWATEPESATWYPMHRNLNDLIAGKSRKPDRHISDFRASVAKLEDAIRGMRALAGLVEVAHPSAVQKILDPRTDEETETMRKAHLAMLLDPEGAEPWIVDLHSHSLHHANMLDELSDEARRANGP